jgi:hypothetical protein
VTGIRKPWVGDQVHDASMGREAIVSDVRDGTTYVLRHLHGGGLTWTAPDPEKLTVTVPREDRAERE